MVATAKPTYVSVRDITPSELDTLCALKDQHWPHGLPSQMAWWREHTADDDVLVTMISEGMTVAFLRLRSRFAMANGVRLNVLCATEVCVGETFGKQGLGKQLMRAATEWIEQTGVGIGYLLCRDKQEAFYVACGWCRTKRPPRIVSSAGVCRELAEDERCMAFDPQNRFSGQIVLYGDVF